MKFTIAAECSEVSTLKNKRNHRCFCQTASQNSVKVRSCSLTTLLAQKGTNFWREEAEHLIANWWAVRQRRFHGTNESIKSRRKEQTIQNEREDRDRNRFQRGKNNSKRENDRSFIGISSSHNLDSEQFRKTTQTNNSFTYATRKVESTNPNMGKNKKADIEFKLSK